METWEDFSCPESSLFQVHAVELPLLTRIPRGHFAAAEDRFRWLRYSGMMKIWNRNKAIQAEVTGKTDTTGDIREDWIEAPLFLAAFDYEVSRISR